MAIDWSEGITADHMAKMSIQLCGKAVAIVKSGVGNRLAIARQIAPFSI
jgi:hypothetical protein